MDSPESGPTGNAIYIHICNLATPAEPSHATNALRGFRAKIAKTEKLKKTQKIQEPATGARLMKRLARPRWGARIGRSTPLGLGGALKINRSSTLGLAEALNFDRSSTLGRLKFAARARLAPLGRSQATARARSGLGLGLAPRGRPKWQLVHVPLCWSARTGCPNALGSRSSPLGFAGAVQVIAQASSASLERSDRRLEPARLH